MLKKLLGKKLNNKKKAPSAIDTISQLHDTLKTMEKREQMLQQKVTAEATKAKEYTKSKNKNAAIQCLKKKKLYEAQMEQLANSQLRVHDQIIMVESAKATTDTIDALRSGSNAVKSLTQNLSVDEIENAIEESRESSESMKEIQDVLFNTTSQFDEDELEAELEELEALDLESELEQLPPINNNNTNNKLSNNNNKKMNELSKLPKSQVTKKTFSRSKTNINEHESSRMVSRSLSDLSESARFSKFQNTQNMNLRNISNNEGESSKLSTNPASKRTTIEPSRRSKVAEVAM